MAMAARGGGFGGSQGGQAEGKEKVEGFIKGLTLLASELRKREV